MWAYFIRPIVQHMFNGLGNWWAMKTWKKLRWSCEMTRVLYKSQTRFSSRRMSSLRLPRARLPFQALLLENFPVEKQPLCLHAGRQSFYFGECMYADLCGSSSQAQTKGQPKKARCPRLSHVRYRRERSTLSTSRWGRCLTMRMVKRWHISMAINIRIKGRRDTDCADCACGEGYRRYA